MIQLPCISQTKMQHQDLNHQEASLACCRRAEWWAPLNTHPVMQRQAVTRLQIKRVLFYASGLRFNPTWLSQGEGESN